ncbi:hypothetical protein PPYR_12590 [Photinus pyralis]|uniref:DOMON domain-containing protein n=1 Tax=Photinus pyralis TaxID=7054 RepID=A0A5N4A6L5_PHOPY|nr:MOXD1 homolog 1 [Photinus pyralis]XP_031355429.1 MOXD1 homolog 1 [Photinus pyralis]KAB0792970.1 hypothetical protein PPYR_12590 [Photinus pyralis]
MKCALQFLTWIFLLKAVRGYEDLVDEYVKHVGEMNSISTANQRIRNSAEARRKFSQRFSSHRRKRETEVSQWTHFEFLDPNKDILLKWQPRHQEMLFRVEARTLGYVGIGFSPNGGMQGADIVLGWIDDRTGRAHLLDCHGGSKDQGSAPIRDEINNYRLMAGIQNGTHTIIEFRRALDTCDSDDYTLGSHTIRMIWALHDKDPPTGAEMVYHGERRGTQSIHLLSPPRITKSDNSYQVRQWDVALKQFEVKDDTTYWCKIFKAPSLQQKHHIVGYEPLIGGNHTSFIHHMILHECEIQYNVPNIKKWEEYAKDAGRPCYGPDMPNEWEICLTPLVAWAVGSKGENVPKHVGLPLAPKTPTYYMLEVHFDNPSMKRAVDTSGLRLHYTHKLRPNEGGFLVAGVTISPLQLIPPQQLEYKSGGYCSMDCTREVLPRDGVNVVSVLLHSHLAGRRLKLRHIRGDKELAPIAQDDNYDFNYQQARTLSHEVRILPGDGLITECTYSTINRKLPTLGGYSTREEMCLAFVLHYPRTQLAGCYSMPPIKYFFDNLGVKEFYEKNMSLIENMFLHGLPETPATPQVPSTSLFPPYKPGDENSLEANEKAIIALKNAREFTEGDTSGGLGPLDQLVIKEPLEFQNKTFMSHLQSLPYNESLLTRRIEEYFYSGLHLTFCRKRDDTLAMAEKVERFPNFTAYAENGTTIQCSYRQKSYHSHSAKFHNVARVIALSVLAFIL